MCVCVYIYTVCVGFFANLSAACELLVAVVGKNRWRNVNLASCLRHHLTETRGGTFDTA